MGACWQVSNRLQTLSRRAITRDKAAEIQNDIRQILFRDWDPIGVNSNPKLSDEYDAYITALYRILVGDRSEVDIIQHLAATETAILGRTESPKHRLRHVAMKLLTLDVRL